MLRTLDLDAAEPHWRHTLRRVGDAASEHDLWTGWDLASLAEGALGEVLDGARLDDASWRAWAERLGRSPRRTAHDRFVTAYWIVDHDVPVGTLGVWADSAAGSDTVHLSSLYVAPAHRGRGLAERALDAAFAAVTAQGLAGLRLDTHWTWQRSLRWYLRRGWWVRNWKHAILLTRRADWPAYQVTVDGDLAVLSVEGRVAVSAQRDGDRLVLSVDRALRASTYATATLAMHLACAGWPLIRSDADWERRWHHADVGGPEGLAVKIGIFEQIARDQGWRVETPVLPGWRPEPP